MATTAEALSERHGARAHSAHARAKAICRHAGIDPTAAEIVPKTPTGRAANALRLAAQSLAALAPTDTTPDPAATARCARNAAAAAALAAQVAHASTNTTASETALRAALTASQAAALAAGGTAAGRDPSLTAAADEAEHLAVSAAREAGWIE